jgi:KDO2-lipid IV(A) lauroyltransferase
MSYKDNKRGLSLYAVRFMFFLTRILPLKWAYSFCTFVVFIGSRFKWKRKKIALENIRLVFPEKTEKERLFIFRESLRKMLKSLFEFAYFVNGKFTREEILKMADVTGLEYLDEIKAANKGAILYSGHFGNFALMIFWLAIKGYPIAAVYKEAKNLPDNYLGNMLSRLNVTPLKYRSDASLTISIIKALKEGKIVLIQNDQSHPNGIYINFFNKSVPSPSGPALLARRVGVPIIPAFIYRDRNNYHHINIQPELPLKPEDDNEKFILVNTQSQIDWIAGILLKHPTEWLWLHNRWKRARN